MNKNFLSLPIFTIALAMAFVFWAPKGMMAADNGYHPGYNNSTNSFASDYNSAGNNAGKAQDRDNDRMTQPPFFQSYGLQGDWRGQH